MTELTKTLDFDLNIESGNTTVLEDATTKSRTAYNKTLEYYFNTSKSFDTIREELPDKINLIKNTVQLIADETYESIQNYYENEDHNRPKQKENEYYPLCSNHGEGYQLTVENDAVKFRISAIPYGQKVRGELEGCDEHLNLVKNALESDNWRVGISADFYHNAYCGRECRRTQKRQNRNVGAETDSPITSYTISTSKVHFS